MLGRIAKIAFSSIYTPNFCTYKDNYGRAITKEIADAKNEKQLLSIIQKHHRKFNMVNISALLKQLNRTSVTNQQLVDLAYKQAIICLAQIKKPNRHNSRGIANIIGYAGNRNYQQMNKAIRKIDMQTLFKFLNERQFVMTFTGICKLNLLDDLFLKQKLHEVIKYYVGNFFSFGSLISLWRNMIKVDRTSPQINVFFTNRLVKSSPTNNLKDFGYLIYCYTKTYDTYNSQEIFNLLEECSQKILYTTRISMQELCIFIDHFNILSQVKKLPKSQQFIESLKLHFVRMIKSKETIDLRTLANGYLSIQFFISQNDVLLYTNLIDTFFYLLEKQPQKISDFESISSLFLQLIITRPKNQNKQTKNQASQTRQSYSKYNINILIDPILSLLFSNSFNNLNKLNDKQFQKVLYAFYLYSKQIENFKFEKEHVQKIIKTIVVRQHLTIIQINSLKSICNYFEIKDQRICQHFSKLLKNQNNQKSGTSKLSKSCILEYSYQRCLKCQIL